MIRTAMFIRDMVIALALAWIGVSVEPARDTATTCKIKGADGAPAMCTGARGASFDVAGFGVEMAGDRRCVTAIR